MKRIFILCLAVVLTSACSKNNGENSNLNKFVLTNELRSTIELESAQMLPLSGELKLTGKVIPDENNLVNIYPMVGGKVTMVDVEIGELVDTKKPLVIINSGEAREFEKEYIVAKDEYELAKKNYEIQLELFKTKFSSERELAYAKKDFQLAKAELDRMEQVYDLYSITNGGNYVIKSPVAGFVIEKKIGPNMQLRPDMNDYILSVARLEEVFIALNIYENDIAKVKLGQKVKIKSFSYPDSVVYGTIDRIENMIDPLTRTIQARVKIKNPKFMFKPEMNCVGMISFVEGGSMLAVKKDALIFDKSKYFVLVYKSDTDIETREVDVYRETDELVYISSGLKKGEKVITKNQLYIYDALND
jgi:cobalt-zinc-cadmium efflux system membrane fusion protein